MTTHKHVPWLLWPFYVLAQLITGILKLTGRLVAALKSSSLTPSLSATVQFGLRKLR